MREHPLWLYALCGSVRVGVFRVTRSEFDSQTKAL